MSKKSVIKTIAAIGAFIGACLAILFLYYYLRPTNIKMISDGKTLFENRVTKSSQIIKEPKKEGFNFLGWYKDKEFTIPFKGTKIKGLSGETIEIYAKWEVQKLKLVLDNDNDTKNKVLSYIYNDKLPELSIPKKTNHYFDGYYTDKLGVGAKVYDVDGNIVEEFRPISGKNNITKYIAGKTNIFLYANYKRILKTYNVSFLNKNDELIGEQVIIHGNTAIEPQQKEVAGYTFVKWDKELTNITSDITIKGIYKINQYQLELIAQGGIYDNQEEKKIVNFDYMQTLGKLQEPKRAGYNFIGYYTDSVGGEKMQEHFKYIFTINKKVYARYTPKEYTVSYDAGDGATNTMTSQQVIYGQNMPLATAPSREGYKFLGYKYNNDYYYYSDMKSAREYDIPNNVTFVADWGINSYIISYDSNGDNVINPIEQVRNFTIEDQVTLLPVSRIGYNFVGWKDKVTGKNISRINIGTTKNYTLVAQWELAVYKIKYNLSGGVISEIKEETYTILTDNIVLKKPTLKGYVFDHYHEGQSIPRGSTGDKTFTAIYNRVLYNIIYNLSDGVNSNSNPNRYTIEDSFIIGSPSKLGYKFVEWIEGDRINKGSTGEKTFTAKYSKIDYKITYDLNGAEQNPLNPTAYTIDSETFDIKPITKNGYKFIGWVSRGSETVNPTVNINKGSVGDKSFKAIFNLINYDIYYDLSNGGNQSIKGINNIHNPSNYNIETHLTLREPTRKGYTFVDWKEIEGSVLTPGSTGNKTFTARWSLNTYKIEYEIASEATNNNPIAFTVESEDITLANPTLLGYEFLEFISKVDNTKVTILKKGQYARNIILVANFRGVDFSITYNNVDGLVNSNPVSYNEQSDKIVIIPVYKQNAIFKGWTVNASSDVIESPIIEKGSKGNIIYTAVYIEETYYISFNKNKPANSLYPVLGEMENQTFKFSIPQALSTNMYTLQGYTFRGWRWHDIENNTLNKAYSEGEIVNNLTNINANIISLEAQWEPVVYTINYDLDGGSTSQELDKNYTVETTIQLKKINKIGYTFIKWYENIEGVMPKNAVAIISLGNGEGRNINLKAYFVPNQTVLTLNPNGGIGGVNITVEYNGQLSAGVSKPYREGYKFLGYFKKDPKNQSQVKKYYDENMQPLHLWLETNVNELVALWQANTYSISYNSNKPAEASNQIKGIMSNQIVEYDKNVTINQNQYTLSGWVFKGWSLSAKSKDIAYVDKVEILNLISQGQLALYAVWEPIRYNITFIKDNGLNITGSMETMVLEYDKEYTLNSNTFSRLGYTFVQWKVKNNTQTYQDSATIKNLVNTSNPTDISLVPVWVANQYTITYVNHLGATLFTKKVVFNDVYPVITTEKLLGYRYLGLFDENDVLVYDSEDVIKVPTFIYTKNISLKQRVSENLYNIEYLPNRPTNASSQVLSTMQATANIPYSSTIALQTNNFTLEGWIFKGWSKTSAGTVLYSDGQIVNKISNINNQTISLYAVWEQQKTTIILIAPSDAKNNHQLINYSYDGQISSFAKPKEPTRTGYKFSGYYINNNGFGAKYYDENLAPQSENTWKSLQNTIFIYAYYVQFKHEINDKGLGIITGVIEGIDIQNTPLLIPETIDGVQISAIKGNAFRNDLLNINNASKLIISKTITEIQGDAFNGIALDIEFDDANAISVITTNMFRGYIGKSIRIPNSVVEIQQDAFRNNKTITDIYIPNTALTIGNNILTGVDSLVNATLPIKPNYVAGDNTYLSYYFGGTGNRNNEVIPTSLKTLNIIEGTKKVGNLSYITSLLNINLPSSIMEISNSAFTGTTAKVNFHIDTKINEIADRAFAGYLGEEIIMPDSVTTLYNFAFANLNNIKRIKISKNLKRIGVQSISFDPRSTNNVEVIIDDNMEIVSMIGGGLLTWVKTDELKSFKNTSDYNNQYVQHRIKHLIIREGTERFIMNTADIYKETTKISLPSTLYYIDDNYATSAYLGRYNELQEIVFPNGSNYYKVENNVLYSKDGKELVLVLNKKNITTFTVPEGVETIHSGAFENSTNLVAVNFPSSLKKVGVNAFKNNIKLVNAEIPVSVDIVGKDAFSNTALTSIFIPSSTFNYRDISIGPKIEKYIVSAKNKYFSADDNGVLYSKDYKKLYIYPQGKKDNTYTVNQKTETIESNAFNSVKGLTNGSLILPNGLLEILYRGIYNIQLSTFNIPDSVRKIATRAIESVKAPNVTLGSNLKIIDKNSFLGSIFDTINIGENFSYDFGNKSLHVYASNIVVDSNNKYYTTHNNDGALYSKDLKKLILLSKNRIGIYELPREVEQVNESAASEAKITTITFASDSSLKRLLAFAFMTYSRTLNITGFNTLTQIEFIGYKALQGLIFEDQLILPEGLLGIDSFAFYSASTKYLVLPSSLVNIGSQAFAFSKIERIIFSDNTKFNIIGINGLFYGVSPKYLELPDNIVVLQKGALSLNNTETIVVPSSVLTIHDNSVAQKPSLKTIIFRTKKSFSFGAGNLFNKNVVILLRRSSKDIFINMHNFKSYLNQFKYYDHIVDFKSDKITQQDIESKTVDNNDVISEPPTPIAVDGSTFDGWYIDKTYQTRYDFTTQITNDIVLYAKWV